MSRPRIVVSRKAARTVDGIVFDSMAEARRYCELKILEHAGRISELGLQPEFELQPASVHPVYGKQRAIVYRADFSYAEGGRMVYEDVKGMETDVYKLKRKLLLAKYPDIDFREVKA